MYSAIGQTPVLPPEGIPAPPGERPQPGTKGSIVASGPLANVPPLYLALGVSVAASLLLTGIFWAASGRKKKKVPEK